MRFTAPLLRILAVLMKHRWLAATIVALGLAWLAYGAGLNTGFAMQYRMRAHPQEVTYAAFNQAVVGHTLDGGQLYVGHNNQVYYEGKILVPGKPARNVYWHIQDMAQDITPRLLHTLAQQHTEVVGGLAFYFTPAIPAASQLAFSNFIDIFGKIAMGFVYVLFAGMMLLYSRQLWDSLGGNRLNVVSTENRPTLKFSDVAGMTGPKLEVTELVEYLQNPQACQEMGGRAPRGILLYGPPGNGKTLLAKAVAGEANVSFLEQDASSFVQMYVGAGAMAVRKLFKEARRRAPCVVFIDEIDAIGTRRFGSGSHDERLQTLNALLAEMQGFKENSGVLVIAATNSLEQLDPALTRAGRFDRKVHVPLPGKEDRQAILEYYLSRLPRCDASAESLASRSNGFSAADLEHWVNEAAIEAARRNDPQITDYHFSLSRDRILVGPRNYGVVLSPREREVTAWHEAGHAIVRRATGGTVDKVSILPRGASLGVTVSSPEDEDSKLATRESLHTELLVLMGGRAAEEICMHQVSAGASNDMERASHLARQAISRLGLGNLGPYVPESKELLTVVDREAQEWVRNAYTEAKAILQQHIRTLRELHDQLIAEDEVEFVSGLTLEEEPS